MELIIIMIIVIAIARSEKPKKELKKKKRKKRGSFLNMFFLEKNPFMKDSAMMVVNFMSNLKINSFLDSILCVYRIVYAREPSVYQLLMLATSRILA